MQKICYIITRDAKCGISSEIFVGRIIDKNECGFRETHFVNFRSITRRTFTVFKIYSRCMNRKLLVRVLIYPLKPAFIYTSCKRRTTALPPTKVQSKHIQVNNSSLRRNPQ